LIEEYTQALQSFQAIGDQIVELSKTADKNKKSLAGSNFYGDKFRSLELELAIHRATIERLLQYLDDLPDADTQHILILLNTVSTVKTTAKDRREALHNLKIIIQTKLMPSLQGVKQSLPKSQQVLPLDVVEKTRGYIEQISLQFNGCYEHGWYDACAVMMRKLIEILIIACYENVKHEEEIKGAGGDFLMLSGLVDKVIADSGKYWNLGRETKKALPQIKALGDRSAHTRRYLSTKQDVDKVLNEGFRVAIEDLLNISGYKK
jgi:hypothetical protein